MPTAVLSPHRCAARRRARQRDDRGATALQLAIVAPTIMIVIAVSVQAALSMYAHVVVLAAAQQAADAARLFQAPPDAGPATANTFLRTAGRGLVTDAHVDVQPSATTVTITITATTIAIIPGPWSTVTEHSSGPRETIPGGGP